MARETLKTWYLFYIKNRDLMLRRIENIVDKEDFILIRNKDKTQETAIVADNITSYSTMLNKLSENEKITIVTLNKREHIKTLIDEWSKICSYKGLTIMFVNPDSQTEKKWIIKPHIHERITEKASLKSGINSIASSVDPC